FYKKSRSVFIQRLEKTGQYFGFLQEKYTGHKEIILYTVRGFFVILKKYSHYNNIICLDIFLIAINKYSYA
ncbi:MAG: hypothetical protein Q8830_03660, partial [Candidatus Phytoplasma australasiaticum]|nr:hypothetical protein [Candidatus Phytoplasma australasiaticum]